jgi:phospholipid/cholesterol/gamma-HCH transport system substrate-binding protein
MSDTLAELPGTLSSAQRTLAQLGSTADNTTDVLASMRPLTDNLVDTSKELHSFADAGQPALEALPDVLARLNRMLDEARPIVKDLGPAAEDLSSVSQSARALSEQLFTHPSGTASQLENLMTGMADWAMATSGFDGIAHYYRGQAEFTPSSIGTTALGPLPPIGKQPLFSPTPKDPNGQSGYPGTRPLPFMPSLPNPDGPDNGSYSAPQDAPRTAPKQSDQHRDSDSASGMTRKQEGDMFDQLLGGGN